MTEKLIRCFVAVQVPATVLSAVEQYIKALNKTVSDIHWVKVNGIHVTLKFLGEIQPALVEQVEEIMVPLSHLYKPFRIKLKGSGCFPNKSKPRVFWLGLEQDSAKTLSEIHGWIDTNLKPLGFSEEERGFSPHLTIGRVRKPQNFDNLFNFIEKKPFAEHAFSIEKIDLMRSELKPTGAEYSEIKSYPLQG